MSSYGEGASEGEINDSRFNDISCISYADRTIDEKDHSTQSIRNDMSSKEAEANTTNNSRSS